MRDHAETCSCCTGLSRRGFMRSAAVGAAAGGLVAASVRPALAQATAPATPDAVLQFMMDGNKRYAEGKATAPQHDYDLLHAKAAQGQAPFAAVLACADSRVPVELVFDQTIGHLFVCRVAGNVTSPEIIASLEYGAAVLGTKVILVLAHESCGAVSATIAGKAVPGQISALYSRIRPGIGGATDVNAAAKANARFHAGLLRDASPVIGGMIKDKQIKVVAGFYELATGAVTLVE
jgi:carbonic anhydrase